MKENYWRFLKLRDEVNIIKNKEIIVSPKEFIAKRLKNKTSILDVGAGERRLLRYLLEQGFEGEYKSCDTDRTMPQDFYSIEETTGEYDAITLIEVLEHIPLVDAIPFLEKASEKLNSMGEIIITTPNLNCVGLLWELDITHSQHYPVRDLCAILRMLGFENQFVYYRVYLRYIFGVTGIREFLNKLLRRLICTDYCQGIIVIGRKPRIEYPVT